MAGSCCGKPNPGPHGQKPKPDATKPVPQAAPKPSTSMTNGTQSFTLNLPSGETRKVNGSLLEAQAQLARLGGRGQIR